MFGLQNCKLSSGHILQSAGLRPNSVLNCPHMECGVVMSDIVCLGRSKVSWNKKDMWSESLHIPRIPKDLKMSLVMLDNPQSYWMVIQTWLYNAEEKRLLLSAIIATLTETMSIILLFFVN